MNIDSLAKSFHVFAIDKIGGGFTDNPKSDKEYVTDDFVDVIVEMMTLPKTQEAVAKMEAGLELQFEEDLLGPRHNSTNASSKAMCHEGRGQAQEVDNLSWLVIYFLTRPEGGKNGKRERRLA